MDAAPPENPHLQGATASRGLSEPLLRYLEARGVLLTLEAQEALGHTLRLLAFVGVACSSLFVGWLLLTGVAADFLMQQAKWSWQQAVAALGGFHLFIAVVFLLIAKSRLGAVRWFGDTLNEFKKDRTWLASQTGRR